MKEAGGPILISLRTPSSILVNEAFLIENGKIRRVEMVGPSSPYHLVGPWPGGLSGQ